MNKRGQVTIFIILGLVILIAFGFVAYLAYYDKLSEVRELFTRTSSIPKQIEPVNEFVLDCFKGTTEDAIYFNSKQGGYYLPYIFSTTDDIAYFYYNKRNIMPSISTIENEISEYIKNNINLCFNDFENFPGFNIKLGKISSVARLDKDNLRVETNYLMNIKKGKTEFRLSDFNVDIKTNLFSLNNLSNQITNYRVHNKDICLSCLTQMASENNVKINMETYDNRTLIYIIRDEKNLIKEIPLEFKFAIEYE